MNLKNKSVLVVGLGKTGEAVCNFLIKRGAYVKVSEKGKAEEFDKKISYLSKKGVIFETGGHKINSFMETDLIVPSPGVPVIPEIARAKDSGIPVISEIELAYKFLKGKIVGITGTNGKSTTTTLTHKILKDAKLKTYLAGNIGTPLITFVNDSKEEDIYVLEISSFQLKHTEKFKPYVSVFLNISSDHLDWHEGFKDYYEAKKRIIKNQEENDVCILNRDDNLVWNLKEGKKLNIYGFSQKNKINKGCYIQKEWILLSNTKEKKLLKTSEIPLFGIHNQQNIMAAALVGHILGIPLSSIKKSIKSFKGLEHRLEKVLTIQGIDFYNDSKATNVDATIKSVQSFDKKIILILGGKDKGGNFHQLINAVGNKTNKIILLGEAAGKILRVIGSSIPTVRVSSLKDAVNSGYSSAKPGEVVLLAPACTSFDMFHNFEERGDNFKKEIHLLEKQLKEKQA